MKTRSGVSKWKRSRARQAARRDLGHFPHDSTQTTLFCGVRGLLLDKFFTWSVKFAQLRPVGAQRMGRSAWTPHSSRPSRGRVNESEARSRKTSEEASESSTLSNGPSSDVNYEVRPNREMGSAVDSPANVRVNDF